MSKRLLRDARGQYGVISMHFALRPSIRALSCGFGYSCFPQGAYSRRYHVREEFAEQGPHFRIRQRRGAGLGGGRTPRERAAAASPFELDLRVFHPGPVYSSDLGKGLKEGVPGSFCLSGRGADPLRGVPFLFSFFCTYSAEDREGLSHCPPVVCRLSIFNLL